MIKYHEEHTWVRVEEDHAVVGITDFAQDELGEIVYVDLLEPGDILTASEEFGQIESTKTTSDLIAPVSGEVLESNSALEESPTLINESPELNGWITKIKLTDPSELNGLLDEVEYQDFLADNEE